MDMEVITTLSMGFGVILTILMVTIIHAGAVDSVGGMDGMGFTLLFITTIHLIMYPTITIDHTMTILPIIVDEETAITVDELFQMDELALLQHQEEGLL